MPRKRQKAIEPLSPTEVEALMAAASRRAPTGIRNKSLIALLYFSGLRISEALSLVPRDLDLYVGSVRVRRGKGGKQRTVGLNMAAQAHLDRWLDTRRERGISSRRPLFCTLAGGPRGVVDSRPPAAQRGRRSRACSQGLGGLPRCSGSGCS